jgi:hypothetical protein
LLGPWKKIIFYLCFFLLVSFFLLTQAAGAINCVGF